MNTISFLRRAFLNFDWFNFHERPKRVSLTLSGDLLAFALALGVPIRCLLLWHIYWSRLYICRCYLCLLADFVLTYSSSLVHDRHHLSLWTSWVRRWHMSVRIIWPLLEDIFCCADTIMIPRCLIRGQVLQSGIESFAVYCEHFISVRWEFLEDDIFFGLGCWGVGMGSE